MTKTKEELPINLETKIKLDINQVAKEVVEKVMYEHEHMTSEEYIYELNKVKDIIKKRIIPMGNRAWETAIIDYISTIYKQTE